MSNRGPAYNPSCDAPGCHARAQVISKRDYCAAHRWMSTREYQALLDVLEEATAKYEAKLAVLEYKLDVARKSWNWPRALATAALWLSLATSFVALTRCVAGR